MLEDIDVIVCGSCFKEDDSSGASVVDWIQCCKCDLWLHCVCAGFDGDGDSSTYVCQICDPLYTNAVKTV